MNQYISNETFNIISFSEVVSTIYIKYQCSENVFAKINSNILLNANQNIVKCDVNSDHLSIYTNGEFLIEKIIIQNELPT